MLVTVAVAGLLGGCADGGGSAEKSAAELFDEANSTMNGLRSVTVEMTNAAPGGTVTTRLRTDLKERCAVRTTWAGKGSLEQIRVGGTDYVRPDAKYLESWKGEKLPGLKVGLWVKRPVSEARPGEGLAECGWPFESFGTAMKGETTRIGGRKAIELAVEDEADGGTYTVHVAAEGEPYLLRVVHKGGGNVTTTSFSAFGEALDIQAPAEVLDIGG
ncbi:hypothetical protein PV682_34310 [Streptomyces niveiscabiei]|uniref:hypothetical protein n=1 Tax=Streptomyces niveiscabiei TaxID=164115 RepID=UPI0029BA03BE|nr:hypothetical protein [Streptomyces niveiscabiei]MDX3386486.1 hypothetical protein [Streptomyces niveiscabiei]